MVPEEMIYLLLYNEILYENLDLQILFVFRRSERAGITFSNDNSLIKLRTYVPFR